MLIAVHCILPEYAGIDIGVQKDSICVSESNLYEIFRDLPYLFAHSVPQVSWKRKVFRSSALTNQRSNQLPRAHSAKPFSIG